MFGYIRVDRAELLGKEYDAYKGIYCALCRQLGRDYSIFARFILSYDCTFYAMLGLDLTKEPPCYEQKCCRFNPLKKCLYAKSESASLSLAAALSVISAYYKLRDDLIDSPWYKRFACRLIQPFFASWRKKAAKKYPGMDAFVAKMLERQLQAERDESCVPDMAAQPTADMLKAACEMLVDNIELRDDLQPERTKRIVGTMGYFIGRWIYLIDAADDCEKDKKHGSFNPYLLPLQTDEPLADYIEHSLNNALSEALLSYGLLDKGRFDPLINNVLCISCVNIQNNILKRYRQEDSEKTNEESI